LLKGTRVGTSTDFDGRYIIDLPKGNAILVFSAVSFKSHETVVIISTTIDVMLKQAVEELEEIVLVTEPLIKKERVIHCLTQ